MSRDFAAWAQKALGIKKGDRVALMMPNILAYPVAIIALARIGAVIVNVNPLYTPRELIHQLNDAGVNTIIVFSGSSATVAESLPFTNLSKIVTVAVSDLTSIALPSPPVDARLKNVFAFADALREGASMDFMPVDCTHDDLLLLQYTGGTTGMSKGAALSHGNIAANVLQFLAMMGGAASLGEEVTLTALPLYHIFGLTVNFIAYFYIGAENWLVADPRDMDRFIDTLNVARPTVFLGVNTLYAGLTLHPRISEVNWSRLKLAGGGGAAIVPAVSERWQAITGQFIREGYGLSETSPIISFNPYSIDRFTATTGFPVPSTDVRLMNNDGEEVAIGEAGEICVRGPQVTRGYWNNVEANACAFDADGYFKTGDIGIFDEQGHLKIVDRKKDMILVSGFNVYPNEVEAVVTSLTGVAECACVGVPDAKTGEAVRVFVVSTQSHDVTQEQVIEHCRTNMAAYKVPKSVLLVDALPKSNVGKILRNNLCRDANVGG
ncbi:MAG: AMP-binding protein [Collimonas sp.]